MKVNAIPKRLLPNTVDYYEYIEDTGEGSSFKSKQVLSFVKIDEQTQYSYTQNGREVVGKAMLYYDCKNSNGLTNKPLNESKVEFENRTYHVVDTDVLRAGNEPHHYEMLLR